MIRKKNLKLEHSFSLNSGWRNGFTSSIDESIIGNKISWFPKDIGKGGSMFVKVLPGVSVLVFDVVLNQTTCFSRLPTLDEEDFWIFSYDLQNYEYTYTLEEEDLLDENIFKSCFRILDSKTSSSYIAKKELREFSLRILIRKDLFYKFLEDKRICNTLQQELEYETLFSKSMDSRSKLVLKDLKKHSLDSFNYEFLLKGAVYNLLGFFSEKQSATSSEAGIIYDRDRDAILRSNDYLLSDLRIPFPGLDILIEIANMSNTKYRVLYKNILGTTPFLLFREKKMLLAKELLESGDFKFVSDVSFELGYNKVAYFSQIYKKHFNVYPFESLRNSFMASE